MKLKKTGDPRKFEFLDDRCIGRHCWAPGAYQHRAPLAGGGLRNTGSPDTLCCLTRAHRGCPIGPEGERQEECGQCSEGVIVPAGAQCSNDCAEHAPCPWCNGQGYITVVGTLSFDRETAKARKAEGWKGTRG